MSRLIPDSISSSLRDYQASGRELRHSVREAANRGGAMLPHDLKHRLETSLNQNLSEVRIHEDHKATLASALAYSQGKDIFFAPGKYQPHTNSGFELLSHEISHVVQQRAGHNDVKIPKGMAEVLDMADLPKLP